MTRFNLNAVSAAVVALAAFAGYATPAAAQESAQTFRACLVPQVGAMYLIGLEGLPAECLSGEHREISWTEGGSPEAASVNTDALQDASVTTTKIASGAVGTDQIATGAITATQIAGSAITTDAIADGAIQTDDIGASTITQVKLAPASVSGGKMRDNSVDGRVLDLRIENVFQTFEVRRRLSADQPSTGVYSVACPGGKDILSGGFEFTRARTGMVAISSRPRAGQTVIDSWSVIVRNSATQDGEVRVHVLCADLR